MPRTRGHLERGDKVEEIVAAAERRLLEGGYAELSMAGIARDLGLAQNAVYWYFPSRDHLLVAALERIIERVLAQKPRGRGTVERVLWFAEQLDRFRALRVAVHERAQAAPVVAELEQRFNDQIRALAGAALAADVPADVPADADLAAETLLALIEGVLLRGLSRRRRDAVIRFGYERLIRPSGGTG